MTQDTHPMPGNWRWWASYDGGERYTVGPADTREALIGMIEDGCSGCDRITVNIAEALDNNQDLAKWFDASALLDDIGDQMEFKDCGADEDGNYHPLDEITKEQQSDLQACVRSTIREWQKRHELRLRSYWFREVRNEEDIDLPRPENSGEEA